MDWLKVLEQVIVEKRLKAARVSAALPDILDMGLNPGTCKKEFLSFIIRYL